MRQFRPWGHIDWLRDRLSARGWSLLACCGSEDRSVALANYLGRDWFREVKIVTIHDPQPLNRTAHERRVADRRECLETNGYESREIHDMDLLAGLDDKMSFVSQLKDKGARALIIDITSFPKSWFFPLIRQVLRDDQFRDVVVTYTSGGRYSNELSQNLVPLRMIPGFFAENSRREHDSIIVGIGFEPLGLIQMLGGQVSGKIKLIFPFPPGPPGHRRNWMFVKKIEDLTKEGVIGEADIVHIDMYDCPQVFDALCKMTDHGQDTAAIAPYGPKTVSLAMCLFALAVKGAGLPDVPAYYLQPLRYDIDYTSGIRMRGSAPDITGYCLRLDGRDCYALSSE